jgi:hypothetical protein
MQQPHEPQDLPVLFLVPVFAQTLFAFVGGDFMSFTFFLQRVLSEWSSGSDMWSKRGHSLLPDGPILLAAWKATASKTV